MDFWEAIFKARESSKWWKIMMASWNLVANVCQITYSYFQAIFSRVARVCKSDQGGPHKFRDNWTSFLKTRLNCSIPGEHPFYFDEVQATSGLIDGHLVYGVFTTPDNSISGSAICAFSLKDITQRYVKPHFYNSSQQWSTVFKKSGKMSSNWSSCVLMNYFRLDVV